MVRYLVWFLKSNEMRGPELPIIMESASFQQTLSDSIATRSKILLRLAA
jgi:hypothetical protein